MNTLISLKSRIIKKIYKLILRPVLFSFPPEYVHNCFLFVGRFLGTNFLTRSLTGFLFNFQNPHLKQQIAGLTFKNPVGLGAGYDKEGNLINILDKVGFSFAEIGSITFEPYKGNVPPRLFRLKKSRGIVVNYGLKNNGVNVISKRLLKHRSKKFVIGASIGKTNSVKTVSEAGGVFDYLESVKILAPNKKVQFLTINISCPNTFGGEPFTNPQLLKSLLVELDKQNVSKPVFIKMPINLSVLELDALLKIIVQHKVTGVVIGNLTKVRDPLLIHDTIPNHIKGFISGKPTQKLSDELIKYTYKNFGDKLIVIGVGGIFSAEDAYKKIKLGASLVQVVTGVIFEGPTLVSEINYGISNFLKIDGFKNISDAVGSGIR